MKVEARPGIKLFLCSDEGEGLFGDGKWALLTAVREHGSLRKAARSLGRGYRKAWGDIRETEEAIGRKIVVMSRGGSSGGSARLTDFGERLLEAWGNYRMEVGEAVIEAYEKHLRDPVESSETDRKERR